MDNASTDDTAQVITAYFNQYQGLIVSAFEGRRGAAIARNTGLALTSGEWIQFLDADDELSADKLANQVKVIEAHSPDVIIAPYQVEVININQTLHTFQQKISEPILRALLRTEAGSTISNLYRKSMLQKVGGWDETLASMDDYSLTLSLFKAGCKFFFDQDIKTTVHRNYNYQSIERVQDFEQVKNNINNYVRFIHKVLDTAESHGLVDEKFKNEVNNQLFRMYYFYKIKYYASDKPFFDGLKKENHLKTHFMTKLRVIHAQISIEYLTAQGWMRPFQKAWYVFRFIPKLFIN